MKQIMTLEIFDRARLALEQARTIDEVKQIRDTAEAARQYARVSKQSVEMQNYCAEIKARADRHLGLMLKDMPRAQGGRPVNSGPAGGPVTLSDIGLTKNQSSESQMIAGMPEEEFEQHITQKKENGEMITTKSLVKKAKEAKNPAKRKTHSEKEYHRYGLPVSLFRKKINKLQLESMTLLVDEDPTGPILKEYQLLKEVLTRKIRSLIKRRDEAYDTNTNKKSS